MEPFEHEANIGEPYVGVVSDAAANFYPAGGRNFNVPAVIPGHRGRNMDLLSSLRRESDVYRAIELVTEQHPDAAQAVQSYIRLANNGHQMEIFVDGKKDDYVQGMWNEFAAQPIDSNTKGFDGLIDQAHDSQLRFGGMGVECVIGRRAKSLEGVHPILPQWITWRQDEQGRWRAYQRQGTKEVELSAGNFFWIALDNKVGQPTGRLMLEPALMAIEQQQQTHEDFSAVLRRLGYPRNDVSIDRKAVIESFDPATRRDHEALRQELLKYFDHVQGMLGRLHPKSDYIHYDDLTINKSQGENSRGIDARSFLEIIDPQVMNGLGAMSILLNRTTGITETWGTVQFKILIQNIKNLQRGSKRIAENICRLWLRVNGIQGSCKFTHNPVDWESELAKLEAALKKQELHRRAEEYAWQDKQTAAKEAMNISALPTAPPDERTSYIAKHFPIGENKEDSEGANEQD